MEFILALLRLDLVEEQTKAPLLSGFRTQPATLFAGQYLKPCGRHLAGATPQHPGGMHPIPLAKMPRWWHSGHPQWLCCGEFL